MEVGRESVWAIKVRKRTAHPCQCNTGSARFGEADVSECEDFARGINGLAARSSATPSNDKSTALYSPEW